MELKHGRAAGIDGLTAEHLILIHAHPVLSVVLSKLFRIIQLCKYVPAGFGYSYIVPIAKSKDSVNKAVTYDDFRGIAISPVLFNVFEYCFINKFRKYLYRLLIKNSLDSEKELVAPMSYIPLLKLWNLWLKAETQLMCHWFIQSIRQSKSPCATA